MPIVQEGGIEPVLPVGIPSFRMPWPDSHHRDEFTPNLGIPGISRKEDSLVILVPIEPPVNVLIPVRRYPRSEKGTYAA